MRSLLHSFLAWFFPRAGYSLYDGGYEITIVSRAYQPTPTSWAWRGVWLSYFNGWTPTACGYEIHQVYVILHVLGRARVLYGCELDWGGAHGINW